jgi:stage II sporulation protein AA (anti-sigma F factor antagonist)
MSELASIVVERQTEHVTISLRGEIDASNAGHVRSELEDAIAEPTLVIDLTRLDYLDSAGIRALFAVAECAASRRCRCRIVVRSDSPVRRVLDVVGISSAFELDGV